MLHDFWKHPLVLLCFCLSDAAVDSPRDFDRLDFSLLVVTQFILFIHKQIDMLFDLFELVNNNTTVLADILLMQSYIVLSLYMYILLYNIIYAILILEWVLDFSPTQTNITMTMISYLIIIILKCHTFEITIIMEVMYLNLESHRLFRIIQLFFKITLFKQILIALYILHVAHGYMKTNLYICGVSSYSTIPYCNQVLRLVTRFLYTAQFVHVQVVIVLKTRTHCLIAFIVIDLYCLITIVSYNYHIMVYAVNVHARRTCSLNVSNINTVYKGSLCTNHHKYYIAPFIIMLINVFYYISLLLADQKILYSMIIILYQKSLTLTTFFIKYVHLIVSLNETILVYVVIFSKISSYYKVMYMNKMITMIQVKAHFIKFNCFSLDSLTNVIILHILFHSLSFTYLLCIFSDTNILHNLVPVTCMFNCLMMYKCDRQLHYQDNSNLLPTKIWMNYIYKNIYIVSSLLMLYIIYIFLLSRLIFDVSDFKFHALWKQLNIHTIWNMSIMMCIKDVITVMYYVLKGYRGADNYIIFHLTYEIG